MQSYFPLRGAQQEDPERITLNAAAIKALNDTIGELSMTINGGIMLSNLSPALRATLEKLQTYVNTHP